MKISKRIITFILLVTVLTFTLVVYKLPYYVYQPGGVNALTEVVNVNGGYKSEGEMYLVTVSGGQPTILEYLFAKFQSFHEIVPLEQVRPDDMTQEDYLHYQLKLMDGSQNAAVVVAYKAANKKVTFIDNGIYVMGVIKGMPAENFVKIGDRFISVDDQPIKNSKHLINYVEQLQEGDTITVTIDRYGEKLVEKIPISTFPDDPEKVGIGIRLVNDTEVSVEPEISFDSGKIGGPSAGLMFALEMYDQLMEDDITKGYQIAGTGEIDDTGMVHRIGGIDKKVVAANKSGIEIFFAPNENGKNNSNYEEAKEAASKINSKMEIIPVDHFSEALEYLKGLPNK